MILLSLYAIYLMFSVTVSREVDRSVSGMSLGAAAKTNLNKFFMTKQLDHLHSKEQSKNK